MFYFWMGFFLGFLVVVLIAMIIYEFHEMNVHPERFPYLFRHH